MRDLDEFSEENRPLVAELRNPDARLRLLALTHDVIEADDELTMVTMAGEDDWDEL